LPILHFYIPYKNFCTEKTKTQASKQASATVSLSDQIHIGATTEKHAIPARPAAAINAAGGRCLSPLVAPRRCSGPELLLRLFSTAVGSRQRSNLPSASGCSDAGFS